jgi:hypothetical protein
VFTASWEVNGAEELHVRMNGSEIAQFDLLPDDVDEPTGEESIDSLVASYSAYDIVDTEEAADVDFNPISREFSIRFDRNKVPIWVMFDDNDQHEDLLDGQEFDAELAEEIARDFQLQHPTAVVVRH